MCCFLSLELLDPLSNTSIRSSHEITKSSRILFNHFCIHDAKNFIEFLPSTLIIVIPPLI